VNYGPVLELTAEQFERELAINLKTTLFVSQAAIPKLRERGGGAIVNFASAAVLKPQSLMASYSAAKAAVAGLTRALARELRDDRIRVNAVAPGTMRTADNLASMKDAKVRWVELDDLVAAVLYLASDEARAVSGTVLPVTGGDV
jgi:NAD(P)-dependent dehydrogenase (short-subunit alcohol dehydrogenase family)